MLGKLSRFASPEIERLLKKIRADEEAHRSELRQREREKLVFPVMLKALEGEFESYGFSRDVSGDGIGLITQLPFYQDNEMYLKLNVPGHEKSHLARCRWSSKFGEAFWTSGWELTEESFDVEQVRQADAQIEWDVRSTEREKYAIPVVIHQKGQQPKVQAFTRNLSGDGANLVAMDEIQVSSFCKLEVVPDNGDRCDLIAKCIWTHQYGDQHWLTGWQFPRLDRIAKFHSESFE